MTGTDEPIQADENGNFPNKLPDALPKGKRNQTNRERREAMGGPMVLVGFGKHDLADLMGVDMEERITEAFMKQWPPRYRRASICSPEDIELFKEFTAFITKAAAQRGK